MKKQIFLTCLSLLFAVVSLSAQNPVPAPDTIPTPVQEGDPAIRTLPPRMDYVEDRKRIVADEIPDAVRQTLESSAQYGEWQKAAIFHEENKDEYIIEFTEAGRTTTHRFNNEGLPIVEED